MKNIIIILVFIVFPVVLFSQQTEKDTSMVEEKPDTTYIDLPNKTIIVIEKTGAEKMAYKEEKGKKEKKSSFDSYYGGLELGLNSYLTPDQSFALDEENRYLELEDSKSLEFNLNLFDISVPIVQERFGITSGLGFSWNNYKFDNKQLVLQNDSSVLYCDTAVDITYDKNKLTTVFLTVPLALEFHFPANDKEIWFLVGGYAGLKIGSHQKLVADNDDKVKTKEDFHLNTFRYGFRAQVGVNSWSIYCTYSATPLFKKGEGPELYPITMGIALAF